MKTFFRSLVEALEAGEAVVVATILRAVGPVPRGVGTKMLVTAGGVRHGSVGGGAGEAAVCARAREVLASGVPCQIAVPRSSPDATLEAGIEVFLDPWQGPGMRALAEEIVVRLGAGGRLALVTVVRSETSGWPPGHKVLVGDGASPEATGRDAALRDAGREALARGEAGAGLPSVGPATALVEVFVPPFTLLLVGAGHVARPLAAVAALLGFEVVVIDHRPALATAERFPTARQLLVGDPVALLRDYPICSRCHVVIAPPDHELAFPCAREALRSAASYVGLLASRQRAAAVRGALVAAGVPAARLAALYSPVGLPIGARTPEEIAVSIAAELVRLNRA